MSARLHQILDAIFIGVGTATGVASTFDAIEQFGRVALLYLSILSVVLLIIINYGKAKAIVKKKLKKWKILH